MPLTSRDPRLFSFEHLFIKNTNIKNDISFISYAMSSVEDIGIQFLKKKKYGHKRVFSLYIMYL